MGQGTYLECTYYQQYIVLTHVRSCLVYCNDLCTYLLYTTNVILYNCVKIWRKKIRLSWLRVAVILGARALSQHTWRQFFPLMLCPLPFPSAHLALVCNASGPLSRLLLRTLHLGRLHFHTAKLHEHWHTACDVKGGRGGRVDGTY